MYEVEETTKETTTQRRKVNKEFEFDTCDNLDDYGNNKTKNYNR